MNLVPRSHEADPEQLREQERRNLWALLKGEPLPGDSALLWHMVECAIRLPNLATLPRESQVAAVLSADDAALRSAWAPRNSLIRPPESRKGGRNGGRPKKVQPEGSTIAR